MADDSGVSHRTVSSSSRTLAGLLGINTIYGIFGVIVVCYGIYITVDKASFVTLVIGTSLPYLSSVLVTLGGAVSIVASLLGCLGTLKRKRFLVFIYLVTLVTVYVISTIGISSAIVFKSWISDQIRTYMRNSLQTEYGRNDSTEAAITTKTWDSVQHKWYCCAVEDASWGVYRQSDWWSLQPGVLYATKPMVPVSCCTIDQYGRYHNIAKCQTFLLGPPSLQSGEFNEAVYYRGCYEMGQLVLYDIAGFVIGMGICMCCLNIAIMCLTLWSVLHRHRRAR